MTTPGYIAQQRHCRIIAIAIITIIAIAFADAEELKQAGQER